FVPAYEMEWQLLLLAPEHQAAGEAFAVLAMAVLGILEGAAGQCRPANLGLRIGAEDAASGGAVQLAVGFESADDFMVLLLLAERVVIELLERVAASVLRPGLEPAAVDLVPDFPKGNAFAALQSVLGGLKAEFLPGCVIPGGTLTFAIGNGIQHL